MDVLSRNLDGAGPLTTVSPSVVIRRWSGRADPSSATALGEATGAGVVAIGRLVAMGPDSVRAHVSLFDVTERTVLGEVEIRDAAARVDQLADSVSVALLRELGRIRPVGAVRHTAFGATSLSALTGVSPGRAAFLIGELGFGVRRVSPRRRAGHHVYAGIQPAELGGRLAGERIRLHGGHIWTPGWRIEPRAAAP